LNNDTEVSVLKIALHLQLTMQNNL